MAVMDKVQIFIVGFFEQVFRLLQINHPIFDLPIWRVWVGIFCIFISIKILRRWVWDDSYSSRDSGGYPRKGSDD